MAKSFMNLSPKECLDCYQEVLANADRHLNIAEMLNQNGEYGVGISHLVLGSEELIKGLILYYEGVGIELRKIKGVKRFFSEHKIRHMASSTFFIITFFMRPIMNIGRNIKDALHDRKTYEELGDIERAILDHDEVRVEALADEIAANNQLVVEACLNFWEEADMYKNRGFYVDFEDVLMLPSQVTKNEYDLALKSVILFKNECVNLISLTQKLTEDDKDIILKKLRKDKSDRFYQSIDKMINILSHRKNNRE